ncbi:MAG: glycosyltransferase family 4 protein [Chthoniobacter sp.]|uniref:glycosyltransferase family 4 protein n=1 Tax=Chthoniobacter sp. TaxID=2510640 RepID=UPI0032A5AF3F
MRLLVVSNLYPPHYIGGYELGCRDVVHALRQRGHDVRVLTSTFRYPGIADEEVGVDRLLQYVRGNERHDKIRECRLLKDAVEDHRAEIVYFWNQAGLCYWLPTAARLLGRRLAFFLSDGDFVSWRIGAWLSGSAAKSAFVRALFGETFLVRGQPIVRHQTCHFASQFLSNCASRVGIAVNAETSLVAHWGIDPQLFVAVARPARSPRRLLYVGQLIPQKGIHTAIAALGLLCAEPACESLTLTIVGGGQDPDYENRLREMLTPLGLSDRIHFLGKVPRTDLPGIYAQHDVLVFPSEWEEPFAITPLEAMASGLVVVGTTTGGSGELFRNRETALTFAAGDAGDCARAIRELCDDPALAESIRHRAFVEVTTRYTLVAMVDAIETGLEKLRPSVSSRKLPL